MHDSVPVFHVAQSVQNDLALENDHFQHLAQGFLQDVVLLKMDQLGALDQVLASFFDCFQRLVGLTAYRVVNHIL